FTAVQKSRRPRNMRLHASRVWSFQRGDCPGTISVPKGGTSRSSTEMNVLEKLRTGTPKRDAATPIHGVQLEIRSTSAPKEETTRSSSPSMRALQVARNRSSHELPAP